MATSNKKRSNNTRPVTSAAVAAPAKISRSTVTEFNPDYTYVKKDLTRIAIMAGSFIVILVVLSFFLR